MDVMTKHIKNIWNLLFLLLLLPFAGKAQEFSDGYISAIVSYQKAIGKGDTMPITIKIIKNDINGFAKFKCVAPQNFPLISPDFVNASATLKDSILEVIWVEIPFEKEFLIEYKLVSANTSATGSFNFSGSFYYLIDKDIKVLKFNNLPFEVSDDKEVLKKSISEYKTSAVKREKNTQTVLQPKDDRPSMYPKDTNTVAQQIINNVSEVPNKPAIADNKSDEPKVELPKDSLPKSDSTLNIPTIVDTSTVQHPTADTIAVEPKVEEPKVEEPKVAEEPKPIEEPKVAEEPKKEEPKIEEPKPINKPEKTVQSTEGIEFKLQIAATRKKMSDAQLKKIYKGNLKIEEEIRGDGWIRYSIARSTSFNEVKNEKKHCGVADAFISASSNGVPMKVSDALHHAKPHEDKTYGKIFYAVQAIALNNYIPISEFKQRFKTDKLIFVEKDSQYYKYLIGYFFSFTEANQYRISLGGDAFVVSYMNGKRLDKAQSIK
jgi:hypothetical protein